MDHGTKATGFPDVTANLLSHPEHRVTAYGIIFIRVNATTSRERCLWLCLWIYAGYFANIHVIDLFG